jgi:hypothetical protein
MGGIATTAPLSLLDLTKTIARMASIPLGGLLLNLFFRAVSVVNHDDTKRREPPSRHVRIAVLETV